MELTEKVVREVKAAAQAQDELVCQIRDLKAQLSIEQQTHRLLESNVKANADHLQSLNKSSIELQKRGESLNSIREALNTVIKDNGYLRRFVTLLEPTNEQQAQALGREKEYYTKLVESYEKKPEFLAVVNAQKSTKELDELISQKRNEYMRLEAEERDFMG